MASRCILRTGPVSAEEAQQARAAAWSYIFECAEANRAAEADSGDQTEDEAPPHPMSNEQARLPEQMESTA